MSLLDSVRRPKSTPKITTPKIAKSPSSQRSSDAVSDGEWDNGEENCRYLHENSYNTSASAITPAVFHQRFKSPPYIRCQSGKRVFGSPLATSTPYATFQGGSAPVKRFLKSFLCRSWYLLVVPLFIGLILGCIHFYPVLLSNWNEAAWNETQSPAEIPLPQAPPIEEEISTRLRPFQSQLHYLEESFGRIYSRVSNLASTVTDLSERLGAAEGALAGLLQAASEQKRSSEEKTTTAAEMQPKEAVKEIVFEDETAYLKNYVDRQFGGNVILHPRQFPTSIADYVLLPTTHELTIQDRIAIQPSEAFCFDGSSGDMAVTLSAPAHLRFVEYAHHFWRAAHGVPSTLPGRIRFEGCADKRASKKCVPLTEMHLPDASLEVSGQMARVHRSRVQDSAKYPAMQSVRIRVESNHGAAQTCLYLFRIFGVDAAEAEEDKDEL